MNSFQSYIDLNNFSTLKISEYTISLKEDYTKIINLNDFSISHNTIDNDRITLDMSFTFSKDQLDYLKKQIKYSFDEYIKFMMDEVSPVVTKAIKTLLKTRDFLGFQLDHALGNISDELFKSIVNKYLNKDDKYNTDQLRYELELLIYITSIPFDADQASVILDCDIEEAEKVLNDFINDKQAYIPNGFL